MKKLLNNLDDIVSDFAAHEAMAGSLADGEPDTEVLQAMKAGAMSGMEAAKDMEALRGRACYRSDQGVGHLDPGAVTMCCQLELLADSMAQSEVL